MIGNRFCSSDSEPVRSAIAAASAAIPPAVSAASRIANADAGDAALVARAEDPGDAEEDDRLHDAQRRPTP